MLQRTVTSAALLVAAILITPQPAHAQQQTVNFTLGYFSPFGRDARVSDDVLNENREFLLFDIDEFGGASVGGNG